MSEIYGYDVCLGKFIGIYYGVLGYALLEDNKLSRISSQLMDQ